MGDDILYLKQIIAKKYPFVDFSAFDFDGAINDILSFCDNYEISLIQKMLMTKVHQYISECLNDGCYQIIIDGFLNFDLYKADFKTSLDAINKIGSFLDEISFDYSVPNLIEMLDSCDELRMLVSNLDKDYEYDSSTVQKMLLANDIVNDVNEYNEESYDTSCISGDENANFLTKNSKYMNLPPLTALEEKEYFEKIRSGDVLSRNEFLERNFKLILFFAKRKRSFTTLSLLDLFQEGYFGLNEAVDKFDPDKGWKFSTYAAYWIKCSITRAIGYFKPFRLPPSADSLLMKCKKISAILSSELGREPRMAEIAEKAGVDTKMLLVLYNADNFCDSLNITTIDDNDKPDGELLYTIAADDLSIEEKMENKELSAKIEEAFELSKLNKNQREVIRLSYGLENDGVYLSRKDIAKKLGVTVQRINQLNIVALGKLRTGDGAELLSEFSDDPFSDLKIKLFRDQHNKTKSYKGVDHILNMENKAKIKSKKLVNTGDYNGKLKK